ELVLPTVIHGHLEVHSLLKEVLYVAAPGTFLPFVLAISSTVSSTVSSSSTCTVSPSSTCTVSSSSTCTVSSTSTISSSNVFTTFSGPNLAFLGGFPLWEKDRMLI